MPSPSIPQKEATKPDPDYIGMLCRAMDGAAIPMEHRIDLIGLMQKELDAASTAAKADAASGSPQPVASAITSESATQVIEPVAVQEARNWSKIESFVDEFISDYEMMGESEDGQDACYTPNENDRALLRDCIAGLLAERDFIAMLSSTAPAAPTEQWTLTAPGGRQWSEDSAIKCLMAEQRDRIPAEVALKRIFSAVDEEIAEQAEPKVWLLEFIDEAGASRRDVFFSKPHLDEHTKHNEIQRGLKCLVTPLFSTSTATGEVQSACTIYLDDDAIDVAQFYRAKGFEMLPPTVTMTGAEIRACGWKKNNYQMFIDGGNTGIPYKAVGDAEAIILADGMRFWCLPPATTGVGWTDTGDEEQAAPKAEQAKGTPGADIQWPKSKDVGRSGDMTPPHQSVLRVGMDSDNDVYVNMWDHGPSNRPEDFQNVSIEFCNGGGGGGKSPRTRAALINLMSAMEADNADDQSKAWPAARDAQGTP